MRKQTWTITFVTDEGGNISVVQEGKNLSRTEKVGLLEVLKSSILNQFTNTPVKTPQSTAEEEPISDTVD